MIRCNLAVLLAERGLKITKVSDDTGISRTTLTSLANNYSQGIQFDTLNTLCIYLKVSHEQLLSFIPFNITYDFHFYLDAYANIENEYTIEVIFKVIDRNTTLDIVMIAALYVSCDKGNINALRIDVVPWDEGGNEEKATKYLSRLTKPFLSDLESRLFSDISECFGDRFNDNYFADITISF